MELTTKKIEGRDSSYAVYIDGKPTQLVIEKGSAPKYRCPQHWSIGVYRGTVIDWFIDDQTGKAKAESTILTILKACSA